jgi:hypothetical protein
MCEGLRRVTDYISKSRNAWLLASYPCIFFDSVVPLHFVVLRVFGFFVCVCAVLARGTQQHSVLPPPSFV